MQYFGEKLKALRIKKGITQKNLADNLGLANATISAYEQNSKYPSVEVLIEICSFFNVSADYMLGLSESMELRKTGLTDSQMRLLRNLIEELEDYNALKEVL